MAPQGQTSGLFLKKGGPVKRAAFYIDGFNVYHPIARHQRPHLKWMSYWDLATMLLPRSGEQLVSVKVFTALATHLPASMVRHRRVLRAWEATGCECVKGEFKAKPVRCKLCKKTFTGNEEKESDVNLAIHLLNDARYARMDVAYVISSDSDLSPAFRMCSAEFPNIELVTVAPPTKRPSKKNFAACSRAITLNWNHIEACVMPEQVLGPDGAVWATRPTEYDPPP